VKLLRDPAFWMALASIAIGLFLYAPDADGAFAIYDGAWYGHYAERYPAYSVLPHHPLFHLVVAGITALLGAAGVAGPGHVAVRLVAGLGGALVVWMVAGLADRRRRTAGAAFAFALFATRGFIAETATGENLFPAFAGALLLLKCASADSPSLAKIGAATALALCLRQDNLLVLPGALLAVAPALPREGRVRRLAAMLGVTALVTIAFYVLAWTWVRTLNDEGFLGYLTRFKRISGWQGALDVATRLALHLGSFGVALVGRHWFTVAPHLAVAAAWILAVLGSTGMLRGTRASRRYATAALVTIAIRLPFFAWFEPTNFEWQLMPMVLLAALGARTAAGEPATSPRWRAAGIGLLVVVGVAVFCAHASNTWTLRKRTLAEAIDKAVEAGGPRAYYLAMDKNAMLALEMRRLPYDQLDIGYGDDFRHLFKLAHEKRSLLHAPIVAVGDRFVETGMSWDLEHAGEGFGTFDSAKPTPEISLVQYGGKTFAAVLASP
jgi:hypothetical protein